ncbi:MAG TPA: 6-phosphogluconolactonase [Sphaerochaeta sp.]|nr:6-phosphogluconolactonase [Sphaerochaeta sp.]
MKKLLLSEIHELEDLVRTHIEEVASQKDGFISIGLPGGRSAKSLIVGMLGLDDAIFRRIRLYLLDERLSGELNADTLLEAGLAQAIENNRFALSSLVIPHVGKPLLEHKEAQFDLIYLGVGEDGHIASLFPGSYPSKDKAQTSLVTNSPKPPNERVTFTYNGFLKHAHKTPLYLLFFGEGKRDALHRVLDNEEKAETLPCSFFIHQEFPVTIITDLEV